MSISYENSQQRAYPPSQNKPSHLCKVCTTFRQRGVTELPHVLHLQAEQLPEDHSLSLEIFRTPSASWKAPVIAESVVFWRAVQELVSSSMGLRAVQGVQVNVRNIRDYASVGDGLCQTIDGAL